MFLKSNQKFGSFDSLTFHNQDNSFVMRIIPEFGANLVDLKISGIAILDGVKDDVELKKNNAYKSTFLAPFPNRIRDGKYEFNNKSYQLPTNEEPRNNALHGLIYKSSFNVVSENIGSNFAEIVMESSYNAHETGYPFRFKTQLTFLLSEKDGFKCTMAFTNLENHNIPFGYGWHPYFKLGEKIKNLELHTPHVKKFNVDDQMIPTGKATPYDIFSTPRLIDGISLDDCFEIEKTGNICETTLKNSKGTSLKLWQETGAKKLNYLQVYVPPHGDTIAIEPQTCSVDAFNNGYGFFELTASERVSASLGITVETH